MEIPPGFTKPLSKRICINDTYMQDDKSKTGSVNELSGKRCSLRERVPPKPFIPVHFRLRPRAPSSPPKQRSDGELASYFCFMIFYLTSSLTFPFSWGFPSLSQYLH